MTNAGLQIVNASGTMQIDADYRNLLMIASGQYTQRSRPPGTGYDDAWFNYQRVNVPKMTSAACMAVRITSSPGLRLSIGSYRGGEKLMNFAWFTQQTITFQYYIFDLVPPLNSNYGLQVFNSKGELVFDALDYPMKIITTVKATESNSSNVGTGSGLIYTGPHENLAASCLGGGYQISEQLDAYAFSMYTRWVGRQLYAELTLDTNPPGSSLPDGQYGDRDQQIGIVDVSNYPINYRRY